MIWVGYKVFNSIDWIGNNGFWVSGFIVKLLFVMYVSCSLFDVDVVVGFFLVLFEEMWDLVLFVILCFLLLLIFEWMVVCKLESIEIVVIG